MHSYPAVLQGQLATSFPAETPSVSNKGKGGEPATAGVSRLLTELDAERPEALLLLEGYNDLLNSGVSAADTVVNALRTDVRKPAAGRAVCNHEYPDAAAQGHGSAGSGHRQPRHPGNEREADGDGHRREALLVDAYTAFLGREASWSATMA